MAIVSGLLRDATFVDVLELLRCDLERIERFLQGRPMDLAKQDVVDRRQNQVWEQRAVVACGVELRRMQRPAE